MTPSEIKAHKIRRGIFASLAQSPRNATSVWHFCCGFVGEKVGRNTVKKQLDAILKTGAVTLNEKTYNIA